MISLVAFVILFLWCSSLSSELSRHRQALRALGHPVTRTGGGDAALVVLGLILGGAALLIAFAP
jgi:hypothetical protein